MRQPTGDNTLAGYVRQSIADIVPTATLRAAPINAEYNKLRDAFAVSSGHKHDGSTGEGGYIPLIGDVDALNKVVINTNNNTVGVFVEVSSAAVEQVRFQDGVILPVTTNDIDLGSSSAKFKDLHLQGTATIATVDINAGNIDGTILGASTPTTATFTSATLNNNLSVTGTSTLTGTTTITSVDLNSGAIDNATIGSATPAAGTFTTLNANTSLVAATADINGGTIDGAALGASVPSTGSFTTLGASGTSTLATVDINGGNIDGTIIGASATAAGSFTTLSTTGQATLASADINGGSIDGSTIGANSASTGAFTTLTSSGGITGNITGNVTGNTAGVHTGNVTGNVTGNLTGNVTAGSGTSTFTNVTIDGTLNMNAGTSATIQNLTAPTNDLDAATKKYVDDEISTLIGDAGAGLDTLGELADALNDDDAFSTTVTNSIATKLPKAGGTMTGAIAMSTNKITGAGDPTSAQDVATKAYTDAQRDTRVAKTGDTMSGALAMGNNKITGLATPTAGTDVTNKTYVDGILGSATVAATSATNAATSETNAATSATAASNSATSAATSATNAAASYDNFDDRYLGAKSSAPTVDNDGDALITGALYFNSTTNIMNVYGSGGWQSAGSAVNGTSERTTYTATAGQTVFAATYDTGYIDVYLNGVKLLVGTDFTATNGTSITLASGASVNDVVDIVAYGTFVLADHYTKTASDARYVEVAGDTMTGNLSFGDNDKAIFGAGSDLQIYHDGSNSYVDDAGTGNLYVRGNDVIIGKYTGETYLFGNADGEVRIYHDGNQKFQTTSTGIDVTGTTVTDGLTVNSGDTSSFLTIRNGSNSSFTKLYSDLNGVTILDVDATNSGSSPRFQIDVSEVQALRITEGGDISFYEDTGTTAKFFWDASSERLGIGTSSPARPLHVTRGDGTGTVAKIANTGTSSAIIEFSDTGTTDTVSIGSVGNDLTLKSDDGDISLNTTGDPATASLYVERGGKVGIGTSSPSDALSVFTSADNGNNSSYTQAEISFGNAAYPVTIGSYRYGGSYLNGIDFYYNNGSPQLGMRIDSSGNLLVGKSSASYSTEGQEFRANGATVLGRSGAEPLNLNRIGSDGGILNFNKDGTTVGSIGVRSNDILYTATADNAGQKWDGDNQRIDPCNADGSTRDGLLDLGHNTGRYKDLYLSGGVYLGGTGSANKLSDYEIGTWTPTVTAASGSVNAFGGLFGTYTKIGREVSLHFQFIVNDFGSSSGHFIVGSLPFGKETSTLTYYTGIHRARSGTSSISEPVSYTHLTLPTN